jgi:flagellar biogenesis protein FliO
MKTKRFTVQILSAGAIALGICSQAHATATLKQVQVSNGSQIDLLFDSKVSKNQIKTEFFNDVIQISLSDVSVYPAKISSVSGGSITKIFAYQYAPKLVRCRLTVKGRAESFKDKIQLINSGAGNGKMITVRLEGASPVATTDHVVMQATRAQTSPQVVAQANKGDEKADAPAKIDDADEKALLERVLKNSPIQAAVAAEKVQAKGTEKSLEKTGEKSSEKSADIDAERNSEKNTPLTREARADFRPLAGGKPLPSPINALGKLAFVIGIFSLLAFGFKKFWKDRAESSISSANPMTKGLMTSLSQFARKGLGKNSKKMIEVISTHHLGPKKSIAVVKVAGRMLVLGITDDAINLITQMDGQMNGMTGAQTDAEMGMDDFGDTDDMGGAFDLESLIGVKASPKTPAKTTKPAIQQMTPQTPVGKNAGSGAVSAGPALFSDILQAESVRPAMGTPIANNKLARPAADVRVSSYGSNLGTGFGPGFATKATPSAPVVSAQAAQGLSSVRAQIRSKLEGLKQI